MFGRDVGIVEVCSVGMYGGISVNSKGSDGIVSNSDSIQHRLLNVSRQASERDDDASRGIL